MHPMMSNQLVLKYTHSQCCNRKLRFHENKQRSETIGCADTNVTNSYKTEQLFTTL